MVTHHTIMSSICCVTTYIGCIFPSRSPTSCAWSPIDKWMIVSCTTQVCNFCIRIADNQLWSSYKYLPQVLQSSMKPDNCSFSIAGPIAWNSLPDHVKNMSLLETFKFQMKIYLFKQSHECQHFYRVYNALSFCLIGATQLRHYTNSHCIIIVIIIITELCRTQTLSCFLGLKVGQNDICFWMNCK